MIHIIVYIVSFLLCVLLAKLNKRSKNYDDALQKTLKLFAPIPVFNTFIAFIGILTVVVYFIVNSEKTKPIINLYNRLF